MHIIGIDLSGPSNTAETAVAVFRSEEGGRLMLTETLLGADDQQIFELVERLVAHDRAVVGIDAPLSYNPGGGDRPADRDLRQRTIAAGLRAGSVMGPTMTRMAYLTLRGIAVARMLLSIQGKGLQIVEVHPGASLALRGAPIDDVRQFKKSKQAGKRLLDWLEQQGLQGVAALNSPSDHYVAACASALAAWQWHEGRSVWLTPAQPPLHPFDYGC